MPSKVAVDTGRIDFAPGLLLQILIAADMVGVGMGVVDGGETPIVSIQNLAHLAACILVISGINQANIGAIQPHKSNFRRALNIIAVLCNLY